MSAIGLANSIFAEIKSISRLGRHYPQMDFKCFDGMSMTYVQWEERKLEIVKSGWKSLKDLEGWEIPNETCYFGLGWSIWMFREKELDFQI